METTAKTELQEIEESTEWELLIEQACAIPPAPNALISHLQRWGVRFEVVYGGPPLIPDFPMPVQAFFRRLALAGFPPALLEWIDAFEARKGRQPTEAEIPKRLRSLIPGDARDGGPPRLDTKRWLDARRAWTAAVYKGSYELRRETIEQLGKSGVASNCFGFDRTTMQQERPSDLAMGKLMEETWPIGGLSASRLADLMGHRKPKK